MTALQGSFIHDLGIVLGVAMFTCALAQRFRIPLILGYLLAGFVIGPYIPIPLIADGRRVETLSEFGVVLVMFTIGLEFSLKTLMQILPRSGLSAVFQILFTLVLGYQAARFLDWTPMEALFLGASLSISSTMVVSKVVEKYGSDPAVSGHVFGILIVQDIAAIALIAALTALSAGVSVSTKDLVGTLTELLLVLVILIGIGYALVPRFIRFTKKFGSPETMVITACGVCFIMAVLADYFGYSVALGSFVAGVLVAESGHGHEIKKLLIGVRDIFAAVFFVSIGMSVDPVLALQHLPSSLVFVALVILVQFLTVGIAGVLSGLGVYRSFKSGLALGQVGEFAFIIASIGMSSGLVKAPLQSTVVTVAILTIFTTPLLYRKSNAIIGFVDRNLPRALRLTITLYETWLENFKSKMSAPQDQDEKARMRKIVKALATDFVICFLVMVIMRVFRHNIFNLFTKLNLPPQYQKIALDALLFLVLVPIVFGFVRNIFELTQKLALFLFGSGQEQDASYNPNKPFFSTLFKKIILVNFCVLVGLPFFLFFSVLYEEFWFLVGFVVIALAVAVMFWKDAISWEKEVRTGTRLLVETVAKGMKAPETTPDKSIPIHNIINLRMERGIPAIGRSLADLNLRALTGATVISITREGDNVILPTGREIIQKNDVLVIAGTQESIDKAKQLFA
jgi:monovalent cation:H+ antiporter-2, CPA2 family